MIGRVIAGKFQILDEIGRGGMGVVYRARQIALDRVVALKMLSSDLVDNSQFCERFRQEAKIIACLNHPHIVQVYDVLDLEDDGGGFCIIMEYVDGHSLRNLLRQVGNLPMGRAVAVAEQIAAGLAYAHGQGIIHRDIKPDNVMMLAGDHVKIMDFGIARLRGSSIRTQTGATIGTPQFMSPEQASGRAVDSRSDLYSLAVVLFSMVTGELPFTGDSPVTVALKHIQDPVPRPSTVNPAVSPALDALILKGMAKRPEDRFQSAEEFREALGRARGPSQQAVEAPAASGEATLVPTPVPALSTTPRIWEDADEMSEAAPVPTPPRTPTPAESTPPVSTPPPLTPVPAAGFSRSHNWLWVAAAVPGLIVLVVVLHSLFGFGDRRALSASDLEKKALPTVLETLHRWHDREPQHAARFIKENEEVLRKRISRMLSSQEMGGRRWEAVWPVVRPHLQIVLENVDGPVHEQWMSLLRQMPGIGPGPRGPRQEGFSRPRAPQDQINGVFRRLHDEVGPDPRQAKTQYESAQTFFAEMEGTSDTRWQANLFFEGLNRLAESVAYEPTNWRYTAELAERLATNAREGGFLEPFSRTAILDEACQLLVEAERNCTDNPEELRKIQKRETALQVALSVEEWLEMGMPDEPLDKATSETRQNVNPPRPGAGKAAGDAGRRPAVSGRSGPPPSAPISPPDDSDLETSGDLESGQKRSPSRGLQRPSLPKTDYPSRPGEDRGPRSPAP